MLPGASTGSVGASCGGQRCFFTSRIGGMAHISIGQTSKMCQRLGTSLNAGVDILRVLQREAEYGTAAYRRNMTHVAEMVQSGSSLAEGMRDCGRFFPPLVCELVDVGEQTGRLESVLLRTEEHYRHIVHLRRIFLMGIFWPALQLLVGIFVIGLLIFVLGALETSVTVFGLSGTRGVVIYAGLVLGSSAILALLLYGLVRGWYGSWPGRLVTRIPVLGASIRTMSMARFAWTLSLALDAGIDAVRAIRMALQSTRNAFYTRHLETAEGVVMRGGQFHEALQKTGAFSRDFLTALQNAELSGTECESLTRLSEDYQRQAESASTALAIAASMVIWGLIGVLLVGVIVYMFLNLYLKPINTALDMMS